MAGMARSEDFKTEECRLLYAYTLFKPRAGEAGKALKYGATLVFPLSARPALEKRVAGVIVEQWGDKGLEKARSGLIRSPFLAGDGKEARNKKTGDINPGLGPDVFFIRVSANEDRQPFVSASATSAVPAKGEAEVYSGCFGFGVINAFAWNNPQNGDGVSFGIQAFYKRRDGDKLGSSGGVDPDAWTDQVDSGSVPDSAKTGAGAGGLFGA